MNKTGNVLDWFLIIAVLLLLGITIFAVSIVTNKLTTIDLFNEVPEASNAIRITNNTILGFDNLMMFVIVGLSLFVLISSAMIYNHPAFFIVGFILLCIAISFAAVISNAFWDFSNSANILATAAMFPKITFLMNKLPFYILFMGMMATIVGYVSSQRQG